MRNLNGFITNTNRVVLTITGKQGFSDANHVYNKFRGTINEVNDWARDYNYDAERYTFTFTESNY